MSLKWKGTHFFFFLFPSFFSKASMVSWHKHWWQDMWGLHFLVLTYQHCKTLTISMERISKLHQKSHLESKQSTEGHRQEGKRWSSDINPNYAELNFYSFVFWWCFCDLLIFFNKIILLSIKEKGKRKNIGELYPNYIYYASSSSTSNSYSIYKSLIYGS